MEIKDLTNIPAEAYEHMKSYERESRNGEENEFERKLNALAEGTIPKIMYRTEEGEFVTTSEYKKLIRILHEANNSADFFLKQGLNPFEKQFEKNLGRIEEVFGESIKCQLSFFSSEEVNSINAYYYSKEGIEYHFDINVTKDMSDQQIKTELVKGFSEKFGWVELFEDDCPITPQEVIDAKFWVSITLEGEKKEVKLIEVDRRLFEINKQVWDTFGDFSQERFDDVIVEVCKLAKKHFNIEGDVYAEELHLDDVAQQEGAFAHFIVGTVE